MVAAVAPPAAANTLLGTDFAALATALGHEPMAARAGEALARIRAGLPSLLAAPGNQRGGGEMAGDPTARLADTMAAEAASLGFTALESALRRIAAIARTGAHTGAAMPALPETIARTETAIGEALRERAA